MTDPRWQLAACSYRAFRATMGVPVRTSCGSPRRPISGIEYVKELAPFGLFGNAKYKNASDAEWEKGYRDRLDTHRLEIEKWLDHLTVKYPGKNLVMLCFEDVWTTGSKSVCHRTWARTWFADRYGLTVPELSPGPATTDEKAVLW